MFRRDTLLTMSFRQAFAGAVKHNFPHHLRLSIHESTGEHKVSMSLLNTKTGFTTPWHCTVAQMADGEWVSAPMGDFKENPRMKIVEERGRPSYFREMTEEEYQEDLRLAEEAAKHVGPPNAEKPQKETRNEEFIHWEGLTYEVTNGGQTKRVLDEVDGWLRGGTLTALMVCITDLMVEDHLFIVSHREPAALARLLCSMYWPTIRRLASFKVISW